MSSLLCEWLRKIWCFEATLWQICICIYIKPYAPLLKRKSVLSSFQNFADNFNKYEACLLNQRIKIFYYELAFFIWYIHTFGCTFQLAESLAFTRLKCGGLQIVLLHVFCCLFLTSWYLLLLLLYLPSDSFLFLFWFFVIHCIAKNQCIILLLDVHYVYDNMLTALLEPFHCDRSAIVALKV